VQKASGPWRTSGEWWREEEWNEDEWDLEVCFAEKASKRAGMRGQKEMRQHTPKSKEGHEHEGNKISTNEHERYRIYFDVVRQGWFARGVYD
jgi:hypothetical protein